eukprot:gnl/TRDRNA2_/TRDRNA2_66990_c0_seq1.p2 gnl/TRDRNA2_/TRDRNA2_66990_c0~~gnl/TRDRNA2_/TRDRNA2_66990_c0_seq1.p2  ORF type:complete len:102 (-),score=8.22 gnl/TRDRNA2_/TRDRNA2_66990_c0_seq1:99-404(-)
MFASCCTSKPASRRSAAVVSAANSRAASAESPPMLANAHAVLEMSCDRNSPTRWATAVHNISPGAPTCASAHIVQPRLCMLSSFTRHSAADSNNVNSSRPA